jgi:abortive infection bacteriophage resistance protein
LTYDPFVHLDPTHTKNRGRWANTIARVHSEYVASNEEFARHNKLKYGEYHLPPIWVTVELMTLGGLRHLYQNWSNRPDRQIIAKRYGLEEVVFDSLLEHLETIRNFCAHHSRLWNRHITKTPKLPKNLLVPMKVKFNFEPKAIPNIYNTILLLDYVDNFISGEQKLLPAVEKLLESFPEVDQAQMGFPS